jgi:hypothetical protein
MSLFGKQKQNERELDETSEIGRDHSITRLLSIIDSIIQDAEDSKEDVSEEVTDIMQLIEILLCYRITMAKNRPASEP